MYIKEYMSGKNYIYMCYHPKEEGYILKNLIKLRRKLCNNGRGNYWIKQESKLFYKWAKSTIIIIDLKGLLGVCCPQARS